jgi:NAD(P)-dependent dehydrogenase (short-subunit alcohol dehydrogenase family)
MTKPTSLLVVGDTAGIGLEIVRVYADRGWSVILTGPLAEMLRSWTLTKGSYHDCYIELADHLERAEWPHKRLAAEFKAFFGRMANAMRVWVEACREIC